MTGGRPVIAGSGKAGSRGKVVTMLRPCQSMQLEMSGSRSLAPDLHEFCRSGDSDRHLATLVGGYMLRQLGSGI